MRKLNQYLVKSISFERLAEITDAPHLKKRYADMAAAYRIMANERKRMIADGTLSPEDSEKTEDE